MIYQDVHLLPVAFTAPLIGKTRTTFSPARGPDRSHSLRPLDSLWPYFARYAWPKFLIGRNVAEAGGLWPSQLLAINHSSCNVLGTLGPQIQWVYSYVIQDRIDCTSIAPDEALIRTHAGLGGFPADPISMISSIVNPVTEEQS